MLKIEAEAERLLEDLGLVEVPVSPEIVCQAMSSSTYRITLEEQPMTSQGFHGISMGGVRNATILVNSNIRNRHRKRFTAAHEIGHVCLHIQTNKRSKFECTAEDIYAGSDNNDNYEREANAFGSSLLMPSSVVSPIVLRNDLVWPLIRQIRDHCDVSLEAAARRVIALSKEACCLIIHKDGEMWNPIKSPSFSTFVPRQPFPSCLDASPDGKIDEPLLESVDECDFADWCFPDQATGKLYYSSIHNSEFNRTMTLLLHDEDYEDEDGEEWKPPQF